MNTAVVDDGEIRVKEEPMEDASSHASSVTAADSTINSNNNNNNNNNQDDGDAARTASAAALRASLRDHMRSFEAVSGDVGVAMAALNSSALGVGEEEQAAAVAAAAVKAEADAAAAAAVAAVAPLPSSMTAIAPAAMSLEQWRARQVTETHMQPVDKSKPEALKVGGAAALVTFSFLNTANSSKSHDQYTPMHTAVDRKGAFEGSRPERRRWLRRYVDGEWQLDMPVAQVFGARELQA
jgi:hypothetical protein